MRRYFFIFLTLITATSVFTGCKRISGKGAVITRTYELGNFDKVDLSSEGRVILVQDANQFVEVETHENLFEALKIKVDGSRLKIGTKHNYNIGKYDELNFYVHMPVIAEANISGSGDIIGDNNISGNNFKANISGSGSIKINGVNAESVKAKISGSGDIVLNGTSQSAEYTISGSGKVATFGLASADTEANISGSGDIETTTTNSLKVNISGSGSVKYKGTPTINLNISGSGEVINAN